MQKRITTIAFLAVAAMLVVGVVDQSHAATATYWKADTIGDWATLENWSPDWAADPVVYQLPADVDWARMGSGTSEITVTSNVDIGGGYFWTNNGYNSVVMDGAAAPSWNSGSIYLSTPEDADKPGFTVEGGTLNIGGGRALIMAWNNASDALGWFVQKAGTVTIAGNLDMCVKSSTQIAYYDLEDGEFTANGIRLGAGGSTYQAIFTQSAGTATVNNQILLGDKVGDGTNVDAKAVYNLDGGELTIKNATPFVFTQPGAPVYLDIDGGALNLKGAWDFATLTDDPNWDIRSAGVEATAVNLDFEEITLFETETYTRITAITDFSLTGDTDEDGDVDAADYIAVKTNFGTTENATLLGGDVNEDGRVDWTDLQLLQDNFGEPTEASQIPEPMTMIILAAGLPALLKRRRRVAA